VANFLKKFAVLALAVAACSDPVTLTPPPLNTFYYPTGLAVRRLPDGRRALLVVSSNFDLRYDPELGGTVIAADPDASGNLLAGQTDLAILGAVAVGTFGGEVALADETSCPGRLPAGAAKVVTATRFNRHLYSLDMDAAGALACGEGCSVALDNELFWDPYGVTVVCRDAGGPSVAAYVTFMNSRNWLGWLAEVDLGALPPVSQLLQLDYGTTYTSAYHAATRRLFVTLDSINWGTDPLRWVDLGTAPYSTGSVNLYPLVGGSISRDLAISNDGTRLYQVLNIYDQAQAAKDGQIVVGGTELAVLSLGQTPSGAVEIRLLWLVPLGLGSGQVRVLPPRPGKRDLVAVTSPTSGQLQIYDDEVGEVVRVFSRDPASGLPVLGKQPFGLAVEAVEAARCRSGAACDWLYVGSFADHWINVVEVDPQNPSAASLVKRIGGPQ
jgi:hypothetical protein